MFKKEPREFKRWHAVVLGLIILVCLFLRLWPEHAEAKNMIVNIQGRRLSVLVADTIPKQIQGLSDRDTLKPYDGMLFIFPDKAERTFVMRRMRFALDMIWIDKDVVVDIAPNVPPEADRSELELTPYTGRLPADKVLEVPAGFVDNYGLKIGDRITLSK